MTPLSSAQQLAALGPTLFASVAEGLLASTWIGEFAKAGQAKIPDVVQRVYVEDRKAYFAVTATQPSHALWFLNGDRYFEIDEDQITLTMAGGDLQKAVDASFAKGLSTIPLQGLLILTQPILMRAGVSFWSMPGSAIITQGNGQNLARLLDWDTLSAHGASMSGVAVLGNQANNSQILADRFGLFIGGANDVQITDCEFGDINGYGAYVTSGLRVRIVRNTIRDCNINGIFINQPDRLIKSQHIIADNTNAGYIGSHSVMLYRCNSAVVERNFIIGNAYRDITVNISGSTVTRISGPDFSNVKPGHYVIYNSGLEATVTAVVDANTLTINQSASLSGISATVGTGDLVTTVGGIFNTIRDNDVSLGISLGISITASDALGDDAGAYVTRNIISATGSSGLSVQTSGSAAVSNATFDNNTANDCGLNGTAGDPDFNTACTISGDTASIIVRNNRWLSFNSNRGLNVLTPGGVVRASDNTSNTADDTIENGATIVLDGNFNGAAVNDMEVYEDMISFSILTAATPPSLGPTFSITHRVIPSRGKRASCQMVGTADNVLPVVTAAPEDQAISGFQIVGSLAANASYRFLVRL